MVAIKRENAWFNGPVLDENEAVLASYRANHTQGNRAVGGKLFLTNRRLVFVPNRVDAKTGGRTWEASVDAVQAIGRAGPHFNVLEIFSGALRSRLVVSTTSGGSEFFRVNGLDRVEAEVRDYIQKKKAEQGGFT
jgi:hypothetical protein